MTASGVPTIRRSSSPARPATSAGGSCRACSPPAIACAASCATRGGCRAAPGPRAWRSSPATCCAGDARRRPWRASASPTTSSTAMASGRGFDERDVAAARAFGSAAAARRRAAHHLPRRPRRPRRRSLAAPALAPGDGRRAARGRRARHRVPRGRGRRLGQHLLRDDPLPDRAPAGHGLPAAGSTRGCSPSPSRRAALPGRGARRARRRGPGDRDRRRRRAHLRRDDARLRRGRGACGAGCSPCPCSRRRCPRTGSTWSRPSRRASRDR